MLLLIRVFLHDAFEFMHLKLICENLLIWQNDPNNFIEIVAIWIINNQQINLIFYESHVNSFDCRWKYLLNNYKCENVQILSVVSLVEKLKTRIIIIIIYNVI